MLINLDKAAEWLSANQAHDVLPVTRSWLEKALSELKDGRKAANSFGRMAGDALAINPPVTRR